MTEEEFERRLEELREAWNNDQITNGEYNTQKLALRQERGTIVWIALNEDGDSVASTESADAAVQRLNDEIGGLLVRIVRRRFVIAFPKVEDGDDIIVPDDAGEVHELTDEAAE